MNPKDVLKKIVTMLSLTKEEVLFTYARLADGTILESPTFDVGESVDVVSEDGKTKAPEGEHEIILKDSEGDDEKFKIMVDSEGKITERENVELGYDKDREEEMNEHEVEEMVAGLIDTLTPDTVSSEEAKDIAEKVLGALEDKIEILKKKKVAKMESIAGEDIGGDEDDDETTDEVEPLTEDMGKMIQKLQYRIEEMEKKMQTMEEQFPKPNEEKVTDGEGAAETKEMKPEMMAAVEPDEEEEELPKLDGAPVEENVLSKGKQNFGKKPVTAQGTFLSKLYN